MTNLERELIRLVCVNAHTVFTHTIGGHSPYLRSRFDRMVKPMVGDMVMEITNWRADPVDRLGKLIRIEQKPMYSKDLWNEEEEGRPSPMETVYVIQTLDGQEVDWTNCSFIKVYEDLRSLME